MTNTNDIEILEEKETPAERALNFFKDNITNIIMVFVYGIYIFKELVKIEETGKTIPEIVADALLGLVMGLITKTWLGSKGQERAMASTLFRKTNEIYGKEIETADTHINELDDWCDKKNDARLIVAQSSILRKQRIKYEDFASKEKHEICKTKEQEKAWDKALNINIRLITPEGLVSETSSKFELGKAEQSLGEHNAKRFAKNAAVALPIAIIFGYFGISYASAANILWSAIQVATWLALGVMEYTKEYFYIIQDYRQRILRKIMYLKEFNMKGVK